MTMMTRQDLVSFIRRHRWGVVSSLASAGGGPQSAVVGIAVDDQLGLCFDTLGETRKAQNLRRDPRVSVVIGWDDERTVQYEGTADEPAGAELTALQAHYFARFPDGPGRLSWPGITYFRIRPNWIRFSDFGAGGGPLVIERSGDDWGRS